MIVSHLGRFQPLQNENQQMVDERNDEENFPTNRAQIVEPVEARFLS